MSRSGSDLFIVDNSDSDWKVHRYLREWCELSKAIDVATGYFEVGGLLALDGAWQTVPEIRILMGDEVSKRTKKAFSDGIAEIAAKLDQSIDQEKAKDDFIKGVPAIVEALSTGQIKCRVYRKDKFHAKAYITHAQSAVIGSAALVGSSNLTYPGICDNVELNVQITGSQVTALQEWYERHWQDAEDVTPDIFRVIEHHTRERSPFEVWAKALFEYARDRGPSPDDWDKETSIIFPKLAGYQRDAYKNLVEIASRYGAAFLCDGVGLGKTYVGLMLIERMIAHHGRRVVLFAPKAAKEDVWEPVFESLLPHLKSDFQPLVAYCHTDLQRSGKWPDRISRTIKDADVIVIDEAHHFRNPGVAGTGEKDPSRYRKLQQYINQPGSRPKQVFFLTATPINNSIHDFRHILGLVTGENQAYFTEGGRNLGIHNLQSHFNQLEKKFQQQAADGLLETEVLEALSQTSEGREIFGELVVQRSRGYVRASEKLASASKVIFPDREAPRVAAYQLKITYGRLLEAVATAFDREKPLFALAIYNPVSYLVTPPDEQDFEAGRQKQVVALIRTLFLKRFESSAIFHYIYAVFHSPGYRTRYAEFLKIDFPRLPLTGNLDLFRELSRLGGELVALHLLESPTLATPVTEFFWGAHAPSRVVSGAPAGNIPPHTRTSAPPPNQADSPVESQSTRARTPACEGACAPPITKPGWTPDSGGTVWLDSGGKKAATTPGTAGFRGVPEDVWNFHIGGYQVCEKWLKDRKGRTLTAEDIAHYHKIVVALTETIRLMAEIDEVIETHGGWPGAFQAIASE